MASLRDPSRQPSLPEHRPGALPEGLRVPWGRYVGPPRFGHGARTLLWLVVSGFGLVVAICLASWLPYVSRKEPKGRGRPGRRDHPVFPLLLGEG